MNYYEAMAVTVPEGVSGGVAVRHFDISDRDAALHRLQEAMHGTNRGVQAGTYTKLVRDGHLWMSDTPAERDDLLGFVRVVDHMHLKTVLVNGLGLGMLVHALVWVPSVEAVDVCEIDPDVIALVGPHIEKLGAEHGVVVRVRQGDAHDPTDVWGKAQKWDAAWHDIWPDINGDDYKDHMAMRRRYGRRVRYQDVWMGGEVRKLHRQGW